MKKYPIDPKYLIKVKDLMPLPKPKKKNVIIIDREMLPIIWVECDI